MLNLSRFLGIEKPANNYEEIKQYYTPGPEDNTLVFESRFESGNLWMALKVSDNEYNLILQNDINTKGNTQWFYFRVTNTVQNMSVKFNIVNFCKSGSLYNSGMKIMIHSSIANCGWFRGGENISYFPNGIKKNKKGKTYYSMSFTYTFLHTADEMFFAYSCPYTFSDIMQYLHSLEESDMIKQFMKRRLLAYSIAGNRCDFLTITAIGTPEEMKERKGVFISARVHPGETVGSWMMHGVLEFLTGSSPEAALLRENFVFKIVPMLNPDGVINGNYRCNLAGADLNRQWKEPIKNLHPTIFAAKKLIKSFAQEREIELVCDLHGHSRRKNIFMYGCNDSEDPEATRVFPYLLSKISGLFSFKSCSFRMQKSKESTLRITIFTEAKVQNTYTLESTFSGCDSGPSAGVHLSTEDLKSMGRDLCTAIMINCNLTVPSSSPLHFNKMEVLSEIKCNPEVLAESADNSSSGSDSDPSEDNLDAVQYSKIIASPSPKRRVSSDVKTKKNKTSPKKDRLSPQLPLKKIQIKEKAFKLLIKCSVCGEPKDAGHVCLKSKTLSNNTAVNQSFQNHRTLKGKEPASKRNHGASLNRTSQSFTVYMSHDGRKVRDQATQTTTIISPKKTESTGSALYFLSIAENTPVGSTSNVYRKSDCLENLVDIEKLKNIFKNEKTNLPSLNVGKLLTSEKFTKTY